MAKAGKPLTPFKEKMGNHSITFQIGKYGKKTHNTTYKTQTNNGQTTRTKIVGPERRNNKQTRENPFPKRRNK